MYYNLYENFKPNKFNYEKMQYLYTKYVHIQYTYYIIQHPVCGTYIILTYKVISNKQNYILLCL